MSGGKSGFDPGRYIESNDFSLSGRSATRVGPGGAWDNFNHYPIRKDRLIPIQRWGVFLKLHVENTRQSHICFKRVSHATDTGYF